MYKPLFLLLTASAGLYAGNNPTEAPVQPQQASQQPLSSTLSDSIQVDGRIWKLGHEAKDEGRLIREYVLENEDANNWTELFSIQQFDSVPVSPQEFFGLFVEGLKQAVPQNKVDSRVLNDSSDTLLGEWWVDDKSQNDQHEWIKIFKEGDDIFIVRYTTKKTGDLAALKKKWEEILTNFKAKKG